MTWDNLLPVLQQTGQSHLIEQVARLTGEARQRLIDQCLAINWQQLHRALTAKQATSDWGALADQALPPKAFRLPPAKNQWNLTQALAAGQAALDAGQVGVILVAGGQGTRLGFDQPKGMYPIGPVSGASLYQILCESVLATSRQHGCEIPLYVMTSDATHQQTQHYLQQQQRFGLAPSSVRLFCQGMLPALDQTTGQALLAAPDQLALSPDGHGGVVEALAKHGCLEDAERRGLRYLFYLQVDNPLVRVADPEFLGYHILSGSEMSTQVIAKRSPTEKVGNVVSIDGKTQIIEYSDLPSSAADRKAENGESIFWAGSIAVHVIDVAFLRSVADSMDGLPFHLAKKKVPCLDAAGKLQSPDTPNAIKLERFVFDLLPSAREAIVMEVDRATTFAPVKNHPSEPQDNPLTVQAQMTALYRSWLANCGIEVSDQVPIEISPLIARSAAELRYQITNHKVTVPTKISAPLMLR